VKEIEQFENKLKNITNNNNNPDINENKFGNTFGRPTTSGGIRQAGQLVQTQSEQSLNLNKDSENLTQTTNTRLTTLNTNIINKNVNKLDANDEDNMVMPKEYTDFLVYLNEQNKMDIDMVNLVCDDKTWLQFIISSFVDNQMDNWELLSELEFYIFSKALQQLMANESYAKLIQDSGLDKNSIINYMIQDYNENFELWTTAIMSILKQNNPEELWYVTHENIIKGRKIKNSI